MSSDILEEQKKILTFILLKLRQSFKKALKMILRTFPITSSTLAWQVTVTEAINYKKLSPSWEANNSHSASQEIPHLLCNPQVHYRVHTSPPPDSILSQMNPVHILTSYLISFLISSPHLSLFLWNCLFPSRLPAKILHAFVIYPMRSTCPTHFTLLDLIP